MSFYGKKWTIDGMLTGEVKRSGIKEYTVRFEREFASIEDIEEINWAEPQIVKLGAEECPLPRGSFDVVGIIYDYSKRAYEVTLRLKAEHYGDVSAYAAELAETRATVTEQAATIEEMGNDLLAAERDAREKAAEIEAKTAEIEAKDARISEQSAQLSEKDNRIATLTQELAEADELALQLYEAQEAVEGNADAKLPAEDGADDDAPDDGNNKEEG